MTFIFSKCHFLVIYIHPEYNNGTYNDARSRSFHFLDHKSVASRHRQSKQNKSGPKTKLARPEKLTENISNHVTSWTTGLKRSFFKNARLSFVRKKQWNYDTLLNTTYWLWHVTYCIRVSIKILNETWKWPSLFISYWYKTAILTEITRKQGNFTANISLSKMSRVTHLYVYIVTLVNYSASAMSLRTWLWVYSSQAITKNGRTRKHVPGKSHISSDCVMFWKIG